MIEAVREASLAQWGLALILLLMAYEWLLSSMDKLLSQSFVHGLAGELQASSQGNANRWYVDFLSRFILPHATVAAIFVELGELLVALGLIAGAIWWLTGNRLPSSWARTLYGGGAAALAGSALMAANYALLLGDGLPWLKTGDPFDPAISVEALLTLAGLVLLLVHLLACRQQTARPGNRRQRIG